MIFLQFIMIFFFLFLTMVSLSMTFIAQNCPSFLKRQRNTFENPPEPIIFIISKFQRQRDYLQSKLCSLLAGFKYNDCPFKNCPGIFYWVRRQSSVICTGTDLQYDVLGYSFLSQQSMSPILLTYTKCYNSSLPSITMTRQFLPYSCFFRSYFSFCCFWWWVDSKVEIMVDFSCCFSILEEEEKSLFLLNLECLPVCWFLLRDAFLFQTMFLRSENGDFSWERQRWLLKLRRKSLRIFLEEEWYLTWSSSSMDLVVVVQLRFDGSQCRQILRVTSRGCFDLEDVSRVVYGDWALLFMVR